MWPHSLVVGIGGTAIRVGTDDADLAAYLEPWRIDQLAEEQADELLDDPPVDYAVELHPPPPANRADPRPLANLRHGTDVIARAADAALMRDGLLRILASFETPAPPHQVRLAGIPILHNGVVDVVPTRYVEQLSHRALGAQGLLAVYVHSVLVNPDSLEVFIDAPLGSHDEPMVAVLGRWWIASDESDAGGSSTPLSPAQRFARSASSMLAAVAPFDPDALGALARLCERVPPRVSPPGPFTLEADG